MTGRTAATPAAKSVELDSVFDELKALLARYASSFTVREGAVKNKRDYHLIILRPLLKQLDGKTCFHMKTLTPELKKDVDAALKVALAAYKKRKWL